LSSVESHKRPGKVDSLLPISHFLDFEAGGRSLAIHHVDYAEMMAEMIQPRAVHKIYDRVSWQNTRDSLNDNNLPI